ncbi:hypothetical protein N0V90_009980 [Kalmusia sp. IMI 367209]|nr:hypothetical protein N0V90_009980 [Kalmusia sp. IMI 367209]
MPQVPSWFRFLFVAKIVIAVVFLGLAAYGATFYAFFAGNGYAIFCSIAIFASEGYYLTTTTFVTFLFNAWAYLILALFQPVWWLTCWADLASWASAYKLFYVGVDFNDIHDCSDSAQRSDPMYDYDAWDDRYIDCLKNRRKKHRDAIAAAAGIGALEW